MPVRNGLCLDHIYVGVSDEIFLPLVEWIKNVSGANHSVVHSGDDHWEGIYIKTRTDAYVELLRERRPNTIGVAFSAVAPAYLDGRKITDEFPDLPWKKGTRVTDKGEPWFDWVSLCDYQNLDPSPPCNVWLMHYHHNHRDWKTRRKPTSIAAISEMAVEAGEDMREEMSHVLQWTPTRIEKGNGETVFMIPDRDEEDMRLRVRFIGAGKRFILRHIEFRLAPGAEIPPPPPSPWVMSTSPGHIRLTLQEKY